MSVLIVLACIFGIVSIGSFTVLICCLFTSDQPN
jgi:hypothetical protein